MFSTDARWKVTPGQKKVKLNKTFNQTPFPLPAALKPKATDPGDEFEINGDTPEGQRGEDRKVGGKQLSSTRGNVSKRNRDALWNPERLEETVTVIGGHMLNDMNRFGHNMKDQDKTELLYEDLMSGNPKGSLEFEISDHEDNPPFVLDSKKKIAEAVAHQAKAVAKREEERRKKREDRNAKTLARLNISVSWSEEHHDRPWGPKWEGDVEKESTNDIIQAYNHRNKHIKQLEKQAHPKGRKFKIPMNSLPPLIDPKSASFTTHDTAASILRYPKLIARDMRRIEGETGTNSENNRNTRRGGIVRGGGYVGESRLEKMREDEIAAHRVIEALPQVPPPASLEQGLAVESKIVGAFESIRLDLELRKVLSHPDATDPLKLATMLKNKPLLKALVLKHPHLIYKPMAEAAYRNSRSYKGRERMKEEKKKKHKPTRARMRQLREQWRMKGLGSKERKLLKDGFTPVVPNSKRIAFSPKKKLPDMAFDPGKVILTNRQAKRPNAAKIQMDLQKKLDLVHPANKYAKGGKKKARMSRAR
ncbi:hypothetical protein AAMO2058_000986600 [Amorphochlora amoebiformis]